MKNKILICLSTIVLIFGSWTIFDQNKAQKALAQDSGVVSLSASCTSSCPVGSEITLLVSATASVGGIGGLEVNLNYDKAKLSYESINYFSGSNDFSQVFAEQVDQNAAVVHVESGIQGGLSEGQTGRVFQAKFKITATGTASFSAAPIDGANATGRVILSSSPLSASLTSLSTDSGSSSSDDDGTNDGGSSGSSSSGSSSSGSGSGSSSSGSSSVAKTTPDYSKSEVIFDKTRVLADGQDKACASIKIENFGKVVTSLKPTVKTDGGLDLSSITLNKDTWSVCATSTAAGSKRMMISAGDVLLKDQNLTYTSVSSQQNNTEADTIGQSQAVNLSPNLQKVSGAVTVGIKKDIFSPKNITDKDIISISGTGDPGITLHIYVHSDQVIDKEVTVGDGGKWSITLDRTLSAGDHRVEVALVDKYGNESSTKVISRFNVVKSNYKLYLSIIIAALVLILLLVTLLLVRRKKRLTNSGYFSGNTMTVQSNQVDQTNFKQFNPSQNSQPQVNDSVIVQPSFNPPAPDPAVQNTQVNLTQAVNLQNTDINTSNEPNQENNHYENQD